jgi:mono/diheme cytochrome c family protein
MKRAAKAAAKLLTLAGGAATVFAAAVWWIGLYDISATDQHLAPTYWVLDTGMRRAIKLRAKSIDVPPLGSAEQNARGLALFRLHCAQCHGAPGIAPEPFALGMMPAPSNLAHTGREWPSAEIFWVVKEGLKMTGMPAWKHRLEDADMWAVVSFVRELPKLSPADYRSRAAALERTAAPTPDARPASHTAAAPDAAPGKRAIDQYLCATCHRIPGIVGANAPVGPPLDGMGTRAWIAGAVPNTPDNMVRWLMAPQSVSPQGAMPDLLINERDARDIAAWLATLR